MIGALFPTNNPVRVPVPYSAHRLALRELAKFCPRRARIHKFRKISQIPQIPQSEETQWTPIWGKQWWVVALPSHKNPITGGSPQKGPLAKIFQAGFFGWWEVRPRKTAKSRLCAARKAHLYHIIFAFFRGISHFSWFGSVCKQVFITFEAWFHKE